MEIQLILVGWEIFSEKIVLKGPFNAKTGIDGCYIGNSLWVKLKDIIRSFAADCSWRLKLERQAAQRAFESRINRVVKVGDRADTKTELLFPLTKSTKL